MNEHIEPRADQTRLYKPQAHDGMLPAAEMAELEAAIDDLVAASWQQGAL